MEAPKEIAKVDELRKQGVTTGEACKKIGIGVSKYSYWNFKKKPKKARKQAKIVVTDLEQVSFPEEKGFLVMGSAAVIAQIMGRLK